MVVISVYWRSFSKVKIIFLSIWSLNSISLMTCWPINTMDSPVVIDQNKRFFYTLLWDMTSDCIVYNWWKTSEKFLAFEYFLKRSHSNLSMRIVAIYGSENLVEVFRWVFYSLINVKSKNSILFSIMMSSIYYRY
jgi:hypothetical protein